MRGRQVQRAVYLAAILTVLTAAHPVAAQTVTDGDTLKLNGKIYRLWGIDATESKQTCPDGRRAGVIGTAYLAELMRGKTVVCETKTHARFGRIVALCRGDGKDLGAQMVSGGMAWAFTCYTGQEARAKAERLPSSEAGQICLGIGNSGGN